MSNTKSKIAERRAGGWRSFQLGGERRSERGRIPDELQEIVFGCVIGREKKYDRQPLNGDIDRMIVDFLTSVNNRPNSAALHGVFVTGPDIEALINLWGRLTRWGEITRPKNLLSSQEWEEFSRRWTAKTYSPGR